MNPRGVLVSPGPGARLFLCLAAKYLYRMACNLGRLQLMPRQPQTGGCAVGALRSSLSCCPHVWHCGGLQVKLQVKREGGHMRAEIRYRTFREQESAVVCTRRLPRSTEQAAHVQGGQRTRASPCRRCGSWGRACRCSACAWGTSASGRCLAGASCARPRASCTARSPPSRTPMWACWRCGNAFYVLS